MIGNSEAVLHLVIDLIGKSKLFWVIMPNGTEKRIRSVAFDYIRKPFGEYTNRRITSQQPSENDMKFIKKREENNSRRFGDTFEIWQRSSNKQSE